MQLILSKQFHATELHNLYLELLYIQHQCCIDLRDIFNDTYTWYLYSTQKYINSYAMLLNKTVFLAAKIKNSDIIVLCILKHNINFHVHLQLGYYIENNCTCHL